MECLTATFQTHEYAPHSHETFSIGAIESGSQIARIRGAREETGPGCLYLINPEVVHDGAPEDSTARDYYVRYRDYIKNVASSEIYATWPDATLRANILAIMSFTLNRV